MALATLVLAALFVLAPVQAGQIEFVTAQLPWVAANKGYAPPPLEVRISGSCPLNGLGYAVVSGELPPDLQLSPLGYFSGTALHTGSFEFTVRAANGCSSTTKKFTLVVAPPPVLLVKPARLEFRRMSGQEAPEGQKAPRGADQPAEEHTLHVSSTWPGLSYRVTVAVNTRDANPGSTDPASADDLWLSATPEHGVTPHDITAPGVTAGDTTAGNGPAIAEDRVYVRVDASQLKPGHYSATITISAWQAVAAPAVTVDLTVSELKEPTK